MTLTHIKPEKRVSPDGVEDTFSASFAKAQANTGKRPTRSKDVRGAAYKEEQAFAELFDRYARTVCGVAMRTLRDQKAANDVTEAAFLMLWRETRGSALAGTPVAGWLALTAHDLALAMLQGRKPAPALTILPVRDSSAASAFDALTQQARHALGTIPPDKRKVLEIAFFDGLSSDEVAVLKGWPVAAVKSSIRSALLALRKGVHA